MAVEKNAWLELNPSYVTDAQGRRTAVVLDIEEYRGLLEQLQYEADLVALERAVASEDSFRPWREVRDEIEASDKP